MLNQLRQDVHFALRSCRRAPGFTAAAVGTLALGIGAATAIFTVVNSTMLASPPYPEPARLLVLTTPEGSFGTAQEFTFVRDTSTALSVVAAQRETPGWNLVADTGAEFIDGLEVTDGYFAAHGVPLLLGREVSRSESQPGAGRSVVIGEALWRRAFGGRRDVIGEIVDLGGRPHTVVGVAPAAFRSNPAADVWASMQIPANSNAANQRLIGRIAPGRTHAEVAAELEVLRPAFRAALTDRATRVQFLSWMTYQEWLGLGIRGILMTVLVGAVGFLLLLACINVAGLQVVRGMTRAGEYAARAALGASRERLFRQAIVESLVIAAFGAAAGFVIALAGTRVLLAALAPDVLAELLGGQPVRIDGRVIGVTVLLAVASAIGFGLAPALGASAGAQAGGQTDRHTMSRRSLWLRRMLGIGQVATAVVLLAGAGLLMRTFGALRSAELGFEPDGVVIGEMAIQGDRLEPDQRNIFLERTRQAIAALPGVDDVAVSSRVPVDGSVNLTVQARGDAVIAEPRSVDWTYVSDDYFRLLEVPVRVGRLFDARDTIGAAPVAIVNEAFAKAFYGRVNVLGEMVENRAGTGDPAREIVGVVADMKARSNAGFTRGLSALGSASPPIMYVPAVQASAGAFRAVHTFTPMRWIVKSSVAAATLEPQVREAVRRVEPRRPFIRFLAMEEIIARDLSLQRFLMTLLTFFSGIGVTLAATGLYGFIAYLASQRTREIGIRMALGATASRVQTAFLREGLALGVVGVSLGLIGATFATQALAVFLVGVTATDGVTLAAVAAVLLAVVTAATFLPARRAAAVNPVQALRAE